MKKSVLVLLGAAALVAGCGDKNEVTLDTQEQKASYAIGLKTGEQMSSRMGEQMGLDMPAFLAGLSDAVLPEGKAKFTNEEIEEILTAFQEAKMAEQQQKMEQARTENLEAAKKFLAENGAKEGVVTTESGLQYEVLASGEDGAATPGESDTVKVNYQGSLINGTVFDSSYERGEPGQFPVGGIIKGWQEALTMMKVGDKWKIVIPPELGYGENGVGSLIGPNETLIFEVELLEINPQA